MNWLAQLGTMLRAVQGRKQVVYLSEGFDPQFIQGRDNRATEQTLAESDAAVVGRVWDVNSDLRFGNATQLTNLVRMQKAFHNSDVILNAIDVRGIRGGSEESGTQSRMVTQSNDGLFLLARSTGGTVFQNSNDVGADFGRLLHAQEVVYMLAFNAPPASKKNTFHPIKVSLVNVPGRPQVTARAGYTDLPEQDFNERLLSTAEIIMNDVPQTDVAVSALAMPFPAADGTAQVPVIVDIDGESLLRAAKGDENPAEIFVYAFGEDGNVRDRLYQNVRLDMKKVGVRARTSGVRYYGTLALKPGRYAIKTLVRGVGGRNGFTRTEVVVPKAGELAAMPIPIDEDPKAVLIKGTSRDSAEAYPFELAGQTFVPCTSALSKVALYVRGANDFTVDTPAKILGRAKSGGDTIVVLEVPKGAGPTLDMTVRQKNAEALRTSIAIH